LAVGYGAEDSSDDFTNYYRIKNSWGANWGDHGYINLARSIYDKEGKCGILIDAIYPTL